METETDWLTGVMSWREFPKHLEMAATADTPLSVLMIGLDHLKILNDNYTHHAGDDVLRNLAGFLEQNVRDNDSIFRYGGNRFTVLLPETPMSEAKAIAEHIHKGISETTWSSHAITVSIGVASWMPEQMSWRDLIDGAEAAVLEAKRAGGNCVRLA